LVVAATAAAAAAARGGAAAAVAKEGVVFVFVSVVVRAGVTCRRGRGRGRGASVLVEGYEKMAANAREGLNADSARVDRGGGKLAAWKDVVAAVPDGVVFLWEGEREGGKEDG